MTHRIADDSGLEQHLEIEIDGSPAFHTSFESRQGGARLDVLVRQEDFRLIAIHGLPGV